MSPTKQILATFALSILIIGCSHPLEIIGDGDITSTTGNRDCLKADFDANLANCTDNKVAGDYNETYYGDAHAGSHFHRWVNCLIPAGNECTFTVPASLVDTAWGQTAPPLVAIFRPDVVTGYKSVLMGHSFFNPFAAALPGNATTAGFTTHSQSRYFEGNGQGAPQAFWASSFYRPTIQAVLDQGDVDLVGMTYHTDYQGIRGYRNWVNYALSQNPDTRFFIHMPWIPSPAIFDVVSYEFWWNELHQISHGFIDTLREENPGVDFFCIPMGQAATDLRILFSEGNLPDVSTLVGGDNNAIYTDSLGHPAKILDKLGDLLWLSAIYKVDPMSTALDTNFTTDLRVVAKDIVDNHDANYDLP